MKRLTLVFLLGVLLAVPATLIAAPPKAAVLTGWTNDNQNPTNIDSHGGTIDLSNGGSLNANSVGVLNIALDNPNGIDPGVNILSGTPDPSISGAPYGNTPAGSLYLRRVDIDHGQLWLKSGRLTTDWTCVAGCSP